MQRADGDEGAARGEQRRGARGHHVVAADEQQAGEFVLGRALDRRQPRHDVGDGEHFGGPPVAIEAQQGRVGVVVEPRRAGRRHEQGGAERVGGAAASASNCSVADSSATTGRPRALPARAIDLVDLGQALLRPRAASQVGSEAAAARNHSLR